MVLLQGDITPYMFKAADVKKLRESLPRLKFSIDADEKFTANPLVKRYLNHYKINFSQSIPGVHHGFGSFEVGEFTIACHYWLPSLARGTIFVIHGYYDHVGLFNHLIRFSLQNEYAVVAYDLPGLGMSSGERASIDSFEQYERVLDACLHHFHNVVPAPWYGVAQSAGSTQLMYHLFIHGLAPFKKMVLLAPLVRSHGWGKSRWLYAIGRFFIRSLPRVFTENTHDQEFLDFLRKSDPLQDRRLPIRWVSAMHEWIKRFDKFEPKPYPVLIVQGDQDLTVDWQHNLEKIKSKLPKAKVKIIKQGRHHLVAESAPYRAQVFAAIKAYLEKS